jgi:hypothetical protein
VITKTDSTCLQVSGIVKEYGRFEYSGQMFTKKKQHHILESGLIVKPAILV